MTLAGVRRLWPRDGVPRSLGVLAPAEATQIDLKAQVREHFADGAVLAISMEPEGGSPTGAPTGPVVATGKLLPL